MTGLTFKKEERLCRQKRIGELFRTGESFLCYPLKVVWSYEEQPMPVPAQVLFSVPKRLYKKAHDRNLLKRRMRECYRKQKPELYTLLETQERQLAVMMVYVAQEIIPYAQLEGAMSKVMDRLKREALKEN